MKIDRTKPRYLRCEQFIINKFYLESFSFKDNNRQETCYADGPNYILRTLKDKESNNTRAIIRYDILPVIEELSPYEAFVIHDIIKKHALYGTKK